MAIPLIWAGAAILGGGLFVGSQIDDAIEKPNGALPGQEFPSQASLFSFTNITKAALVTGTALIAYNLARNAGIVK